MGNATSMSMMFRQLIAGGNGKALMEMQDNIKLEEEGPQLLQVRLPLLTLIVRD